MSTLTTSLTGWFRLHSKSLLLAVLMSCIAFPAYNLSYSGEVDGPLAWVFNYFANGHFKDSIDIVIPHGRLAFLIYPLDMGHNLTVAVLVTLLCSILFGMNLFNLVLQRQAGNYILTSLLLLIVLSFADITLLLIGLTFSYALLFHRDRKWWQLMTSAFFCTLAVYVKSYCGIISVLILLSECAALAWRERDLRPGLKAIALLIVFFYLFWLSLYHRFAGSLDFIRSQVELSSDNSEAVALYRHHNWKLLSLFLVSLAALPLFSKDKPAGHFFKIMLPALFAAWKHAMARSDNTHLHFFVGFLVLLVFSFFLLVKEKKIILFVLGLVSICAFQLNIPEEAIPTTYSTPPLEPQHLYRLAFDRERLAGDGNWITNNLTKHLGLPDSVLKLLGNNSTDVYPWNYALIARNHLNWQPRPVLHSYAAYTPWIDRRDAAHFQSAEAARFLVWEINKNYDHSWGKMNSIDSRYLLNDEPVAILQLFSHFKLAYKDSNYLVYEKRKEKIPFTVKALTQERTLENDHWTDVPVCDPRAVMRAKVTIRKSFGGRLLSFIYKGEAFLLKYEFEGGSTGSHRIVPKSAADGIWLYPFIRYPGNDHPEKKIKRIAIVCSDDRMVDTDYKIQFEEIGFQFGNERDFLENAFGKTWQPASDTLH